MPPSRRALLTTATATVTAGLAGCAGGFQAVLDGSPPIDGPCPDVPSGWPTTGGDPGRTGRTDTAPPSADADAFDPLAAGRVDGSGRLTPALPAIADETLYAPNSRGVAAVPTDPTASEPIWDRELEGSVEGMPAVACGAVFVPELNQLTALDRETGETLWRTDRGSWGPAPLATLDETLYVGSVDPVAIDLRSGEEVWTADGGRTLALDENGVYATDFANGTGSVFAYDHDGEELWHLALGKIVGAASVLDGTVIVADNGGTVYAIDAASGETYWSRRIPGVEKVHTGLAIDGDDIVVPAGNGDVSAVLDVESGEPRWTADTGIVLGRPVVGDDWVAFARTNHGVSVYDRATGELRASWTREEYDLGTIGGLAPIEDGFVVFESGPSRLRLLR